MEGNLIVRRAIGALLPSATANAPTASFVVAYLVLTKAYLNEIDAPLRLLFYNSRTLTYLGAGLALLTLLAAILRGDAGRSIRASLLNGLPVLLLVPPFFSAFGAVKSTIGRVVPFYFDPVAANLDRALFGQQAWKALPSILTDRWFLSLFWYAYAEWFVVTFYVLLLSALMVRRTRLRTQFLLAFFLSWSVIGNLVALITASAGPCYYAVFHDDLRFDDLTEKLRSAYAAEGLSPLTVQDRLLTLYQRGSYGIGEGISAFPSVHVAIAALVAIMAFRFSLLLGVIASTFALAIFLGSIALGWHYAVDGIAAVLLVWLIWLISGQLAARWHRKEQDIAAIRV